ncbi:MAG: hypothetical protein KTR18_17020 [Acidiferrobacterales bacterium]|nr:hypothetical protein [Acidiferrobacterales bacterium]
MILPSTDHQSNDQPIDLLASLGIQGAYERSFKIWQGSINSDRYVVGLETSKVSVSLFHRICDGLGMPESLQTPFFEQLQDANTVLLGFEQSDESEGVFKVYLEFMDGYEHHLRSDLHNGTPFRLGIGLKWQRSAPSKSLITHYDCVPNCGYDQIIDRVQGYYAQVSKPVGLRSVLEILQLAIPRA